MTNRWLEALKEERSKHNTAAALRVRCNPAVGEPNEKPETPKHPTDKTDKITSRHKAGSENPKTPETRTDKTDKNTSEAERLGMVATWAMEFGYVSLHDPHTGKWHDIPTKEAPSWALWEARRRKELYKDGNRKAFRLTSSEMEDVWEKERAEMWEHPAVTDRGIVYEDYLEEGAE